MAVSPAGALVRMHLRSTWNRILREAGTGGAAGTFAMLALVAAVLLLPGWFALRTGLSLGGELARGSDPRILSGWIALQATFTIVFGILGSFRFHPAFPFERFGRYPVTPVQLLLAELPASALEVFPLLGAIATVLMHAGLAARMPESAGWIFLLTLADLATLASLIVGLAALRALAGPRTGLIFAAGVIAAAALLGRTGALREAGSALEQGLPLAFGSRGLLSLRSGDVAGGLRAIGLAVVASAILAGAAARLHAWRVRTEAERSGRRRGSERPFRFRHPAAGLGRLFVRRLFTEPHLRVFVFLPLLFTVPMALASGLYREALVRGKPLPEDLLALLARSERAPWHAVVPFLVLAFNAEIWMNQFGWDRRGVRMLLALPIDPRHLLLGRMRGLAVMTSIQIALGMIPLLWMRTPGLRELAAAALAGAAAFVVTTAAGHLASVRFPRAVDGASGARIPLHLSWVPPAVVLCTGAGLAGLHAIGALAGSSGGLAALALAFAGSVAGYRAILPRLSLFLDEHRERLLGM